MWFDQLEAEGMPPNLTVCRLGGYDVWDLNLSVDGQMLKSLSTYENYSIRIPNGEREIQFSWPPLAGGTKAEIPWKFDDNQGLRITYRYEVKSVAMVAKAPTAVMEPNVSLKTYKVGDKIDERCG